MIHDVVYMIMNVTGCYQQLPHHIDPDHIGFDVEMEDDSHDGTYTDGS